MRILGELFHILGIIVRSSAHNIVANEDWIYEVKSPTTSSLTSTMTSPSMFGYVIAVNKSLFVGSPKSKIKRHYIDDKHYVGMTSWNFEDGNIYSCSLDEIFSNNSAKCSSMDPPGHANEGPILMNLAADSFVLIACAPHIQQTCQAGVYLPGYCFRRSRDHNWTSYSDPEIDTCPSYSLDLMFVLDGSGSVGIRNFEIVKSWVDELSSYFLSHVNHTQIGVVQYSYWYSKRPPNNQTYMKTEIPLGSIKNAEEFKVAIGNITLQGYQTFTAHALNKTVNDFMNSSRYSDKTNSKVLILLTDGTSDDRGDLPYSASYVRSLGIQTYAIGVNNSDITELKMIATGTNSSDGVFHVGNFTALENITSRLRTDIVRFALEGSAVNSTVSSYGLHFAESGFSIQASVEHIIMPTNHWMMPSFSASNFRFIKAIPL